MQLSDCYKFVCGEAAASNSASCTTVSGTTVTLYPCASGYYCNHLGAVFGNPGGDYEGICTPKYGNSGPKCPDRHNGHLDAWFDYCCEDDDCISNKCESHMCIQIDEGGSCVASEACKPGLYCSDGTSGTCIKTIAEGKACSHDYQCSAGLGCNDGYCFKYWSLDFGAATSDDAFCKSGYSINGKCDTVSVFINSQKISEPWPCTIGDTCNYFWDLDKSLWYYLDCECDGKGSTTGYCPINVVPSISGFEDNFYEKFQFSDSNCTGNYTRVGDSGLLNPALTLCNSISIDASAYLSNIIMIKYYWALYSSEQIDSCAKEMQLFDPNYNIDSYGVANRIELLSLSAFFILFN